MATINMSFTVPDDKRDEMIRLFCAHHGYHDQIEGGEGTMIPNPQTKAQFIRSRGALFFKDSAKAEYVKEQQTAAGATAASAIESINVG